ncbi:MAG: hypothetical protein MUP30_04865 [Deltaproteobacteria bacterium]|nr:hypothetical protein [Deltaproteobacteria bacterium]
MKKQGAIFFVVFLVSVVIALNSGWGQEKNLRVNKEVTAKIRAVDREFFKGFDVYSAGLKEAPTALLFDIKGGCSLPCKASEKALSKEKIAGGRIWGPPLSEAEIIDAIQRLDYQYKDPQWIIPFAPRALNIVDVKGEVVGYVYTGLNSVLMDRKKDGTVIVYPPTAQTVR